jgi:hypothetical protein
VLAALLALLPLAATPDPAVAARLAKARSAMDHLEYEAAALELTLVAADPNATEEQRVEANLWAGVAQRVLGNDTDARLHFLYVLRRTPDAQLPSDVGPKIRTLFELVREEATNERRANAPPTDSPTPEAAAPMLPPPAQQPLPWSGVAVGGGALVAVGGGALFALGAQPWLAHQSAREELARAAAANVEASAAADAQRTARADWESWGVALTAGGAAGAALGLALAGVGAALWMTEAP